MRIEKDMKLADVIHHDFNLIPVINRFGIQLGFGDGTIEQICKEQNVNAAFFLIIINTYHDPQYFPKEHLQSFPAGSLIEDGVGYRDGLSGRRTRRPAPFPCRTRVGASHLLRAATSPQRPRSHTF